MKFITVSVLTVGATLTGVLAAPIMTGGDIANLAAANMEKREAVAQPDQIQNGIFDIGLAGEGDPYWCGSPFCGKEKREAVAEPVAIAEPEAIVEPEALAQPDQIQNGIFDIGLAAEGDPYWCGSPFCDKEKREAVAEPEAIAEPDYLPSVGLEIGLDILGDPYWCGQPSCSPRDAAYDGNPPIKPRAAGPATVIAEPATVLAEKREAAPQFEPCGPYECCDASCEPQFGPPVKREAEAEDVSEVKLVKRPFGPPAGFPHPKCGNNLCQPYARPASPPLLARATHALTEFVKRQYDCGAPFCFGEKNT